MSCPSPEELLARVIAGEDVPHLDECEDCAWYVAAVYRAGEVFNGSCEELQRAVAELVDEALEGVPSKQWAAELVGEWGSYNSLVIAELLRRADRAYENPSIAVDLTSAAVALCEARVKAGTPPPAQVRFDALKEHATALRAANDLNGSLEALVRASAVASELENREQLDAVVALCTALTYSEADLGKFDEAIALAERAEGVLELCGDRRRALMARQTKGYALVAMQRYAAALAIALPVAQEYDATRATFDAAAAHHMVATCYVELGTHDEALGHALIALCGFEQSGNAVTAARASHVVARAMAGLGRFEEARAQFEETAAIVFGAGLYDVWVLNRLDYVAAALHHDPAADVRGDVEAVAVACLMLGRENSTMRRRYAAEALDYLRQLAKRDALTVEAADYVRDFVSLNAARPPVRFTPPSFGEFVM
jgi:tetratricopeptide (TPR) repeat protein